MRRASTIREFCRMRRCIHNAYGTFFSLTLNDRFAIACLWGSSIRKAPSTSSVRYRLILDVESGTLGENAQNTTGHFQSNGLGLKRPSQQGTTRSIGTARKSGSAFVESLAVESRASATVHLAQNQVDRKPLASSPKLKRAQPGSQGSRPQCCLWLSASSERSPRTPLRFRHPRPEGS